MNEISLRTLKLLEKLISKTKQDKLEWADSYLLSPEKIKKPDTTNKGAWSRIAEYSFFTRYRDTYIRITLERLDEISSKVNLFELLETMEEVNDDRSNVDSAKKQNKKRKRKSKKKP